MQVRPQRRAPITQVLLVGGATRMPAFRRFVRNMTGLEAREGAIDPDEVRSASSNLACHLMHCQCMALTPALQVMLIRPVPAHVHITW